MPFNSIMNVNYDYKSVLKLSFSRKKMLNLFLKDLFLVIFYIFLFCYNSSTECQISIIFCFFDIGVFDKDLYYNVLIFQYFNFS